MHEIVTVVKTVVETSRTKTIFFRQDAQPVGGQFLMVWIPGVDEVPMSYSYTDSLKAITVSDIGDATKRLCGLKKGDRFGIRGPLGNGFDLSSLEHGKRRKLLAVGGGVGMAPIAPAVEHASEIGIETSVIIGAKTAGEIIFEKRMKKTADTHICTDDGTKGYKGFTTDFAANLLKKEKFDCIITCGPEIMMKKIIELGRMHKIPVQASVERFMKCGIGICDACAIGGKLVCRDGPVFTGEQLAGTDFGICTRTSSGLKIPLKRPV